MCLFSSTFMFQPQRTVGDYLDHSIIPRPTYTGPFKPIHHSSRLPLSHTEIPVHVPTPRLSLDWGFLSLVSAELGRILGFQRPISNSNAPYMVPPAILVSLLHGSNCFTLALDFDNSGLKPRQLPPLGEDPDSTYLPALNCFLPHNWCSDVCATITSVKNDDGFVPIHLWNDRITPLFPSFST